MTQKILVPVDLAHTEKLAKALDAAADLAKRNGAQVVYAGVAQSQPSEIAHNPDEYREKLDAFTASEGKARGIEATDHMIISHDRAVDLAQSILKAVDETGADLVVMASHLPGLADHIFHSNAGYVASHAPVSVYVVR